MENTKNTPNVSCECIKAHLKAVVDQLIEALTCEICEICSSCESTEATEHEIAIRERIAQIVTAYEFVIGLFERERNETGRTLNFTLKVNPTTERRD